jgi:hypothetical protein
MPSIRHLAACMGLGGNLSVVRDFFGYIGPTAKPLSLRTQAALVSGPHLHLNLIRVAIDGPEWDPFNDDFQIDNAVLVAREVFATVGLGIGRVQRFFVPVADAEGHEHLSDQDEGEALRHKWTVPNDALDAFFVLTLETSIGFSSIDGPCDKNEDGSGTIVAVHQMSQVSFAHELGHYLGLVHEEDDFANLMHPVSNERGLTPGQGDTMRAHCFVKPGC